MHEGHRRRMQEKLFNAENLEDHELMEVLLFSVIPRVNTNITAHNLTAKFGNISGIFNATYEQLVSVEGVGKITAFHIMCIAECMKRAANEKVGVAVLKNISEFKKFVTARLRGRDSEIIEIYCLDKNGKVLSINTFSNGEHHYVLMGTDEVARIFASEKPYGVVVAHNHLSGSSMPSVDDNRFTGQFATLCSINNVKLHDHCIYAADNDVYSYRLEGGLEKIKEEYSFLNLINEHIRNDLQKK